jgi:hypothetical protein
VGGEEQEREREGQSSGGRKEGDGQEEVLLGGAAPATPSAKVAFSVGCV